MRRLAPLNIANQEIMSLSSILVGYKIMIVGRKVQRITTRKIVYCTIVKNKVLKRVPA